MWGVAITTTSIESSFNASSRLSESAILRSSQKASTFDGVLVTALLNRNEALSSTDETKS